ncbi:hypothetical protein SAMN04489760_1447 [Syntrophus gentianae]|uniref:VPLPA-CTERM protein sorting domain-containing protein n=1 Tax=Syntrophus gentianae TaxID=43775 RepID=A0A1H8B085_9BACT|nr:hypothetical protein [Syntrophus gentianae]SEM76380.1 hypothetical protein SAMN04489760_1447 [Syntrophus gentianae]
MRKFGRIIILALFLGSLVLGATAHAATSYTTLTLPTLNTDISTWSDGSTYDAVFPGNHTWNGVPFSLVVDEDDNNVFYGATLTIPVNVYGATSAYTMINSYCGVYGVTIGKIEFYGSDGAYCYADLVEGINVRDHFAGAWNNIIDGVNAMAAFDNGNGRARLDMQIYSLTADFSDETLTDIVFTSYMKGREGQPFIAAATVAANAVPIPPAVLLFGSGLIGLIGVRKKFTK